MKKLAIGLVALVAILVAAVAVVPRVIDWNGYKPEIAAAARDALGRELTIDGDINVAILPGGSFSAAGVRLANAEGAAAPDMARIGRIEGEIALLPLISGTLAIKRLVLVEPVVALEIDAAGQPNWRFAGAGGSDAAAGSAAASGGAPLGDLQLDDVRIEGGQATFIDARTGQRIEARDISLQAALPKLSETLRLQGAMVVNDEPTTLEFRVSTPRMLMEGERADIVAKIAAKHITAGYEGGVRQAPTPGLDGVFDLDIPSAGALAAWLGRPLPEGQPDPGPVKAHAVFEADGGGVAIKEARLEGEQMRATADGALDLSGDAPKLRLNVESGVIDVDRYLPAPATTPVETASRPQASGADGLLDGLSDAPFDLGPLKSGVADIRIAIDGVRAGGFEVGEIRFVGALANGRLTANLERLALYGGAASAALSLDANGDALAMDATAKVDGVDTSALSRAATGGPPPVTGVVAADLAAKGAGASPKAMVESLTGRLGVDLGGLDLSGAAPGAVSGLKVDLALPGIDQTATLNAAVVYNKEQATLTATVDPLPKVLSADRFAVDASVASKRLTASYKGDVLKAPVAGLDGAFDAATPSVAGLAAWLGQPLDAAQPDPGPLKARARFAADGGAVEIREAVIEGDGLRATANGSWSQAGDVTRLKLQASAGRIDLDRYLPKPSGKPAPAKAAPAASGDGVLAGLSNAPIDFSALRRLEADVDVGLDGLKASGYEIGKAALALDAKGGVMNARIRELALYGGAAQGEVSLDTTGKAPAYRADLKADGLQLGPLLRAAVAGEPPAKGALSLTVKASGSGASPRAMATSATAEATADAAGLVLAGAPPRRIPKARLAASIAGVDKPTKLTGEAVFEGEPVTFSAETGPIGKIAAGERFAARLEVNAAPVKASYDGAVQQRPAPGLDGRLAADAPSVGKLLAWLGQPLPKDQPDPGPLSLQATLAADGSVVEVKQADIKGKAIQASADARLDIGGTKPVVNANINVNDADLDAYLPPPADDAPAKQPAGKDGKKWSTEPIDFSALTAADGKAVALLRNVKYRGLNIASGKLTSTLKDGVMTTNISDLRLASGAVNGVATIDGGAKTPSIKYDLKVEDVQARPLLKAIADFGMLSGRTALRMTGTATGRSERALVSSLTGDGEMRFFDGAIHGINLASVLRQVGTLGFDGGEDKKTDFAELGGTFDIKNGKFANLDFKMLAPLLRLSGKGTSNMPGQTIDYGIEANLVDTLKGQGGDDALAGLPIPIRVGGTYDAPTFEIDWKSVFQLAAKDPARLKALPNDLAEKAKSFGVSLGDIGGGKAATDLLKALPTPKGGGDGGGAGGAIAPLKDILGGKKKAEPAPKAKPSAAGKSDATADQTKTTKDAKPKAKSAKKPTEEKPAKKKIEDKIKGLLGQ